MLLLRPSASGVMQFSMCVRLSQYWLVFVILEVDAIVGDEWLIYQGQHDAEVRTTHLGTSNSNLILTGRQVCILLSCFFLMKFVFRINGGDINFYFVC